MLGPLTDTIHGVVNFTWPMLIISIVIMVSVRLTYLIKEKQKIVIYKELLMLSFAIYILCLFQVVTFQDDVTWSSNNFIPFREIFRYSITDRLFWKNVIGNMIMFLPFGFFISYYLKVEKITLPLILTLVASIAVEFVQMCIGRVFDVDDILLNLLGGTVGFCIYSVLKKIGEKLPKFFHNDWVLDIGAIIVLIGLFMFLI
ncbi:MAG: VanZ family protein [Bacilli bacterium]|nr:VanZ family protein [Bacilli bacterium]MBR6137671.1 VanZ family protein [Bacilli bacterium]